MNKLLILISVGILLVGCHKSVDLEVQKASLNTALKAIQDADTISMTFETQKETTYLQKDGVLTESDTTHIGYRNTGSLFTLQYVKDSSTQEVLDFLEKDTKKSLQIVDKGVVHDSEAKAVDLKPGVTVDVLSELGISFLDFKDAIDFDMVDITEQGKKTIYSFTYDVHNYEPVLDVYEYFQIKDINNSTLREYTIVVENDKISNVTLIYTTETSDYKRITNVSFKVNAYGDAVSLQYIDVDS